MVGGPLGDRVDAVGYSPLVFLLEDGARLHEALREELKAIEALEGRLAGLLADPRVARRLRRENRRRERTSHLGRPPAGVTPRDTAAVRAGMRPPSKATVERYADLIDDLDALAYPTSPDQLARLNARLAGVPAAVPFRSGPATVRGVTRTLQSPRPEEVPTHVQRVLHWGLESGYHPVLAAAAIAGDILAIRPFKDNEPLLSRLLMRIVLRRNGLGTAADIALDARIDLGEPQTLDRLIEAVERRDPLPWLLHTTALLRGVLHDSVDDAGFAAFYVDDLNERQWRLAEWFRRMHERDPRTEWRFRDIHAAFENVPARTLKRDLATLRDAGLLTMEGKLKSARYRWGPPAERAGE